MSAWKAPPGDKCPKCGKAVYANEAKLGAGSKWHSMCFKCTSCNKMLESTNVAEHDGSLYCKSCHGKSFGPKGYGYGQGAGVLSMDTGSHTPATSQTSQQSSALPSQSTVVRPPAVAESESAAAATGTAQKPFTNGCPRCGKRAYEAEKRVAIGRDWHRSCFNCVNCHKSLDSTTLNDKDGEIYCKGCYGKFFGPKGVGYGIGAGTLQT